MTDGISLDIVVGIVGLLLIAYLLVSVVRPEKF